MERKISKPVIERLKSLCEETNQISNSYGIERWMIHVSSFLSTALGSDEADIFLSLKHDEEWQELAMRLGHLQGLMAKGEAENSVRASSVDQSELDPSKASLDSKKVFIVHGRNTEAMQSSARLIERLGLQAIILHEQPNQGRTIIEKFETYSDEVAFAIVLLTADDIGSLEGEQDNLKPRARQNVILELGYFMGRLGRTRVCALYQSGVDLPSDIQGVAYVPMDDAGHGRQRLPRN